MSSQHLNLSMKYHQGAKISFFFCLTPFHIKYCYTKTGGERGGGGVQGVPGEVHTRKWPRREGSTSNGYHFQASDIERVRVSLVEVYERVGKFIIVICERT